MAKKVQITESIAPLSGEEIEHAILLIRGQKVMLDRDLARLYGVETKALKRAAQRNLERFPADFMFQLTPEEHDSLRFQFGTLKRGQHSKYLPFVFTQKGVAMLSGVLRSPRAVRVNIAIMRAFVRLRETLSLHKELAQKLADLERKIENHDENIRTLFDAIRQLMTPPETPHREIGFHVKEDTVPYRVKPRKLQKLRRSEIFVATKPDEIGSSVRSDIKMNNLKIAMRGICRSDGAWLLVDARATKMSLLTELEG